MLSVCMLPQVVSVYVASRIDAPSGERLLINPLSVADTGCHDACKLQQSWRGAPSVLVSALPSVLWAVVS